MDVTAARSTAIEDYNRGVTLLEAASRDAAIACWNELASHFSQDTDPIVREHVAMGLFNIGAVLGKELGRPDEARELYERVIRDYAAAPEPAIRRLVMSARYNMASNYAEAGLIDPAIRVYQELVDAYGADQDQTTQSRVAQALFHIGEALTARGVQNQDPESLEAAIGSYTLISERFAGAPESRLRTLAVQALMNKATLCAQLGRVEEASEIAGDVASLFADSQELTLRELAVRAQTIQELLGAQR